MVRDSRIGDAQANFRDDRLHVLLAGSHVRQDFLAELVAVAGAFGGTLQCLEEIGAGRHGLVEATTELDAGPGEVCERGDVRGVRCGDENRQMVAGEDMDRVGFDQAVIEKGFHFMLVG